MIVIVVLFCFVFFFVDTYSLQLHARYFQEIASTGPTDRLAAFIRR